MYEWIQLFTFFNWLALTAFIFSLISVLNSFLGLRSRWRDWRALRNKKEFNKRLEQFQMRLHQVERYRQSAAVYFREILPEIFQGFIFFLLTVFITTFPVIPSPVFGKISELLQALSAVVSLFLLAYVVLKLTKLNTLAQQVSNAEKFAIEIINFVYSAKRMGISSEAGDRIADSLHNNDMLTDREKLIVKVHLASVKTVTEVILKRRVSERLCKRQ